MHTLQSSGCKTLMNGHITHKLCVGGKADRRSWKIKLHKLFTFAKDLRHSGSVFGAKISQNHRLGYKRLPRVCFFFLRDILFLVCFGS